MIAGIKNIDWKYVGAVLARTADDEQAEFFKSFVKECNSYGTNHQAESQLMSINFLLTDSEKELLSYISYKEGE